MSKIKDLSKLNEGDKVLITDHEWQLKSVDGTVFNTMVYDDGVDFVRVFVDIGGSQKLVSIYQTDVDLGISEVEKV